MDVVAIAPRESIIFYSESLSYELLGLNGSLDIIGVMNQLPGTKYLSSMAKEIVFLFVAIT